MCGSVQCGVLIESVVILESVVVFVMCVVESVECGVALLFIV